MEIVENTEKGTQKGKYKNPKVQICRKYEIVISKIILFKNPKVQKC